MKQAVSILLGLMVLLSGLIVVNVYQTKDELRLENIEQTPNSFKLYLTNSNRSSTEVLDYFEQLAKQNDVTVIRTDFNESNIVKSAVVSEASFPFDNFFQSPEKFDLFENKHQIYTPQTSKHKIPVFTSGQGLVLQSMAQYFASGDQSANGIYTIILNRSSASIIKHSLVDFFNQSATDLFTAPTTMHKSLLNGILLELLGLFGVALLLALLAIIAIPILQMKTVGVWKLLGFTSLQSLIRLYWIPISTMIVATLLVDGVMVTKFRFTPAGFWRDICLVQGGLWLMVLLAILLVLVILHSITILRMLTNTFSFKPGIGLMMVIKTATISLIAGLLVATLSNVRDVQSKIATYHQVSKIADQLTVESIGYASAAAKRNFELNNGGNERLIGRFFQAIEKQADAQFVFAETMQPFVDQAQETGVRKTFGRTDRYQVLRVNRNFLIAHGVSVRSRGQNLVLIPAVDQVNAPKMQMLAQLLIKARLSALQQDQATLSKQQYELATYATPKRFSVFEDLHLITVSDPIIEVIPDQNLDVTSLFQLQTTGPASPMKVPNTASNRRLIKSLTAKNLNGISLHFATVKSIINADADSSRLGLNISVALLGIVSFVSLIVSAFTVILYFETYKYRLGILKSLGMKIIDRYHFLLLMLLVMDSVQILVTVVVSRSGWALGIGALLAVVDLTITLLMFVHFENRNLITILKGA